MSNDPQDFKMFILKTAATKPGHELNVAHYNQNHPKTERQVNSAVRVLIDESIIIQVRNTQTYALTSLGQQIPKELTTWEEVLAFKNQNPHLQRLIEVLQRQLEASEKMAAAARDQAEAAGKQAEAAGKQLDSAERVEKMQKWTMFATIATMVFIGVQALFLYLDFKHTHLNQKPTQPINLTLDYKDLPAPAAVLPMDSIPQTESSKIQMAR